MAANNRMTNERYHEWVEYFEIMEENKRKKQEREFLLQVLENGTVIDKSLGDYDLRLDCVRSNASEEVIVQYKDTVYYLYVENEICDDRIILCQEKKTIEPNHKEQKFRDYYETCLPEETNQIQSIKEQTNAMACEACGCSPCDCNWGY